MKYHKINTRGVCFYCGIPQEHLDHAPPKKLRYGERIAGYLVPACAECNLLLSNSTQPSLRARRAEVKTLLQKKYRRILATPAWHPLEIAQLGPELQDHLISQLEFKKLLESRLAFAYEVEVWKEESRPSFC